MANGSRRTALGALLLTLGIVLVSAPSHGLDVADENTAARIRAAAEGSAPSAAFIQFAAYGGGDTKGNGLCSACAARVIPEPGMLALIGAGLVTVGVFVRRRLLDREGESETA